MSHPILFCALTLPPPVHGMAYINQKVLGHLKGPYTHVVDLSPRSFKRGLAYHARKISRVILACFKSFWLMLRYPYNLRTFYTVLDGGFGAYYTLLFATTAHALGYRIFIHHHNATHTKATTQAMRWLAAAVPQAVHIALSEGMRADILQRYPKISNVIVSDNTCHLTMPTAPKQLPHQGPLRLGMLSNLTVEKGAILALETALAAHRTGLDITMTLAGPIVEEEVSRAAQQAAIVLGPRLILTGPLHGDAKVKFLREIDVFLFPTMYLNETQGLVNLEAMSQGCLVIAYGRGYIPEVLGPDNICVPPEVDFTNFVVPVLLKLSTKHLASVHYSNIKRYKLLKSCALAQFETLIEQLTRNLKH